LFLNRSDIKNLFLFNKLKKFLSPFSTKVRFTLSYKKINDKKQTPQVL